jgi:hypothetical protein
MDDASEKSTICTVWLSGVNADGSEFNDRLSCRAQAYQMFRKLAGQANK